MGRSWVTVLFAKNARCYLQTSCPSRAPPGLPALPGPLQTPLPSWVPTYLAPSLTRCTLYRMLMPRVMNGLEKSMTFSLSDVMVSPATARSAFWGGGREIKQRDGSRSQSAFRTSVWPGQSGEINRNRLGVMGSGKAVNCPSRAGH